MDRLAAEFSRRPPNADHAIPEVELKPVVREGIARAKNYGFKREWDIYRYVLFQLKYGAEFEKRPEFAWVEETLRRTDYDSTRKMDSLAYQLTVKLK